MLQRIVLASHNPGKLREFQQLFSPYRIDVIPQGEFGVTEARETGLTFVENALIKARKAATQTGLPALADDSGLVVDALEGAPGIYSSRYAGVGATHEDNIRHLLHELKDVPEDKRQAHFNCVLVYMRHGNDPTPIISQGRWEGRILFEPKGEHGFGYDPIFYVPSHNCSAAELTTEVKDALSHRGHALKDLLGHFNL